VRSKEAALNKQTILVGGLFLTSLAYGDSISIPYLNIDAPVVHWQNYHVLHQGQTYVVLDGSKGLSILMIGESTSAKDLGDHFCAYLQNVSLKVELEQKGKRMKLDQAYDSQPKLEIISQGPTHVAARAYFKMCSDAGMPVGTGTLDFYVYPHRLHLVPSLFIDWLGPDARITEAGLFLTSPGRGQEFEIKDKLVPRQQKPFFRKFSGQADDFFLTILEPDQKALRMGWLRPVYPKFMYLREIDQNPETDELYERWPPWISQRGSPLGWTINESSGIAVDASQEGRLDMSILWNHKNLISIPEGGYQLFNGVLAVMTGQVKKDVETGWLSFATPVRPLVQKGDFRFYNEIEGLYELDSQGGDVDLTFDCSKEKIDRSIFVRLWNLKDKTGYVVRVNGQPVPFSLMNDGDIVEDPMVFVDRKSTGPARSAVVIFTAAKGEKARLTMTRTHGIQLTYQMYSETEIFEAWTSACTSRPLFELHLKEMALYRGTRPGGQGYAFFKLPLHWLKNGVNPATFMNNLRGFSIRINGPDFIQFDLIGVDLQGTGLSRYSCRVPYETKKTMFEVDCEFAPLDDGRRWTALEYCDLYPFEDVYRRNFHYKDVIFLDQRGVFKRVGTGAWGFLFKMIPDPARLGYYSEYIPRQGPGAAVPSPDDGSVWILGDNPERGNILFRKRDWQVSEGTKGDFSLCNAWMDVHNSLSSRKVFGSREKLSYTVEIIGGPLPSLDKLNGLLRRAAKGEQKSLRISAVTFSKAGVLSGFVLAKEKKK